MILLPALARASQPWKNGAGTTTDVLVFPQGAGLGDFVWRVSIAAIESDSVFSSFPGVDRILMPLSSGGLVLRDELGAHPLAQFEPFGFVGEAAIDAVDVVHRSLDLNLMTRRGAADGSLTVTRVDGCHSFGAAVGTVVIVVLDGVLAIENGASLEPLDAALLDENSVEFRGDAVVAVVSVAVRS